VRIEEQLRRELPALADALLDTGTGAVAAPVASPGDVIEVEFELDPRPRTEEHTMTKTRWLLAGVAAAVILVIVGVVALNNDDEQGLDTVDTPEAPTATVAPTTTVGPATTVVPTTTPAPEVLEVAEQIRAYFDARAADLAAPVPDPDLSRFSGRAGGPMQQHQGAVQGLYEQGRAIRPGDQGPNDLRVGFVDVEGDGGVDVEASASAVACEVNYGVLYEVATGNVVNDDVATREFEILLVQVEGVWEVVFIEATEQWDGEAGCALSPTDYPL